MIRALYILVPFGFIATGWSQGHYLSFLIGALIVLSTMIKNLPVRLFLYQSAVWCFILQVWVLINPFVGLVASRSVGMILNLILGFSIYVAVAKSKISKEAFFNIICIGAIIQSLIALLQAVHADPVFWLVSQFASIEYGCQEGLGTGTLRNTNYLAAYLAISAPFFFRKRWCYFLPVITYLLLTLNTTTAIVAVSVGLVAYFRQWWVLTLASLGAFVFMCFIDSNPVLESPRFTIWGNILRQLLAHPLEMVFGYSPGAQTGYSFPLHNEWLELFYRWGVIGVFTAAMYIKGFFGFVQYNRILTSALVVAAVNCLGNHPLHLAPSTFLIMIIMGLLEREQNGKLSHPG